MNADDRDACLSLAVEAADVITNPSDQRDLLTRLLPQVDRDRLAAIDALVEERAVSLGDDLGAIRAAAALACARCGDLRRATKILWVLAEVLSPHESARAAVDVAGLAIGGLREQLHELAEMLAARTWASEHVALLVRIAGQTERVERARLLAKAAAVAEAIPLDQQNYRARESKAQALLNLAPHYPPPTARR